MTTLPRQIQFSKEELEKIISYIPYNQHITNNYNTSNEEEISYMGSKTMEQLGIVSEIINYRINLQNEMKKYNSILENVKLKDSLKRFLDHLIEKAKLTIKNKTSYMRIFFNKFPMREFTTVTVLKEDMTTDQLYEVLNDHLQSNASEKLGDWTGMMIVSRVIPRNLKTNENW